MPEDFPAEIWRILHNVAQGHEPLQLDQQRTEVSLKLLSDQLASSKARADEEFRRLQEEFRLNQQEFRRNQEQNQRDAKERNRAWGKLANKLGTVLEDITAPNIERMALEEFGFGEVLDFFVRVRRTSVTGPKRKAEFDVICVGPSKVVYAEMKSTPSLETVAALRSRLDEFFDFFPDYSSLELIGVYASWSLEKQIRMAISAAGRYGVTMGDDTMDIVARPAAVW